jgi:4-hydroxymandelate synthase
MTRNNTQVFDGMSVDHVELYVADLAQSCRWLSDGYGFGVYADSGASAAGVRSIALGHDEIRLLLTSAQGNDHPAAAYVDEHGDGVAGIALRVADAAAAFDEALRGGASPVAGPCEADGVVTAKIMGFGAVVHTFVQRAAGLGERGLPGLALVATEPDAAGVGLSGVDHFAVCLEAGQLVPTVGFYEQALGFRTIFGERIVVGAQAMDSRVVQSSSGGVTLTLIEPDVTREPGQIDSFLKNHGGAGIQHIAFSTDDIVRTVGRMAADGVQFLSAPDAYYALLGERFHLARHSVDALRALDVLVDQDPYGQLFQIFTRSVHPRGTLFIEIIERSGARTFGSGNIKAL